MLPGLLGRKIGMTHIYNEAGKMIPVTVIEAGPVFVTQIKNMDVDGYCAVQVGFEKDREKNLTFPKFGHLKKAGLDFNVKHLREFRVEDVSGFENGQSFNAEVFNEGDDVVVVGTSKGKGFQGVMKRHGFSGQNQTHGLMTHRRPLSSGATGPQRVFKGVKKPGRTGGDRVSQKGLKIVKVDVERNLILVDGSVPGVMGGLVTINKVVK